MAYLPFNPKGSYPMKTLVTALLLTLSTLSFAGPKVEFKTSVGDFVVELNPEKAPKTVENFLGYVNSGFYNGTIFHRAPACRRGGMLSSPSLPPGSGSAGVLGVSRKPFRSAPLGTRTRPRCSA